MQDSRNSSALAIEFLQFCTKPSTCALHSVKFATYAHANIIPRWPKQHKRVTSCKTASCLLYIYMVKVAPIIKIESSLPCSHFGSSRCFSDKFCEMNILKKNSTFSLSTQLHLAPWACLTHWGRNQMDAVSQTTVSNEFSGMKMYEYRLRFNWNLFLRVQWTIFQHWFR